MCHTRTVHHIDCVEFDYGRSAYRYLQRGVEDCGRDVQALQEHLIKRSGVSSPALVTGVIFFSPRAKNMAEKNWVSPLYFVTLRGEFNSGNETAKREGV